MWSDLADQVENPRVFWSRVRESVDRVQPLGDFDRPRPPRVIYEVWSSPNRDHSTLTIRLFEWSEAVTLAALGHRLEPERYWLVTRTTEWSCSTRHREVIAFWSPRA